MSEKKGYSGNFAKHQNRYVHSSNAEKLRSKEQKRNQKSEREKRAFEARKRMIKEKERKIIEVNRKIKSINRVNMVLAVMIVGVGFACAMVVLTINDGNSSIKKSIMMQNDTIKQQTLKIDELNVTLAQSYDLKNIEKIATNQIGMSKPDPSQIVYVTLPKQSYIEYNAQDIKDKGMPKILKILGKVIK